jgi:cell wall-associated NlpC family hydrolase
MKKWIKENIAKSFEFSMTYNCYNYPNTKLKAGDLVFFKTNTLFESNFISGVVASSPTGKPFDHVAIVVQAEVGKIGLIDATPKQGVVITEYKNLCKTHGFSKDIEVLRMNLAAEKITKAVNSAINLVGNEYNDLFTPNFINSKGNKAFYCSQLIQYAFNMATQRDIFADIPMSFKDSTGEISQYWKDYYEAISSTIPQDVPGTHPASIYESEFLMCF